MERKDLTVRLINRRSSIEGSVREMIEIEFMKDKGEIDLNVSVYLIPNRLTSLIQISAEHAAQANLKPDVRFCIDVNSIFEELADLVHMPCDGFFSFRNERHHELHISDVVFLEKMVRLIKENFDSIAKKCAKSDIKAYAQEKLNILDSEWVEAFEQQSNLTSWRKKPLN